MNAVDDNTSANAELERLGYAPELKRSMSLADVVIYGLIYMVPIAPIAVFGIVYNFSSGAVALVYIVAAIAMVFSALSYREMALSFPIADDRRPGSMMRWKRSTWRSRHPNRVPTGGVGFRIGHQPATERWLEVLMSARRTKSTAVHAR